MIDSDAPVFSAAWTADQELSEGFDARLPRELVRLRLSVSWPLWRPKC